jgi:ubiquinone/menaquinone biosynthesis C-methylase UbiE
MDQLLEATARAEREHFWFRGFRRFVEPLLATAAGGRPGLSILDCGCGTGHNLTVLRRHGRAIGIDLTWTGLVFARKRGERAVAQASATHLPFEQESFDVVTSFDVIYALDDQQESMALQEMFRVLKPGGHLILNVAALDLLKGNHSVLGGEVRRYTRPMLAERLERAGFTIRRLTYTNASILPVVAGVRLAQRLSGYRQSTSDITIPPAPINFVLTSALAAEAAALRVMNMPIGSSLLTLAMKPA